MSSPGSTPMTPFTPPSVNRTLKPKKVGGVTMTVEAAAPPSVNRQLKPHRNDLYYEYNKLYTREECVDYSQKIF